MSKSSLVKFSLLIGFLTISGCNGNVAENNISSNNTENTDIVSNPQISKLQKPVLTAPMQPALSIDGKEAKVTFSWTGNAEHYDLMVRNPDSNNVSYIKANIKNTTATDSFLPNEKPYTWWIRAYSSEVPLENFIDSDFGQFTVVQESEQENSLNNITNQTVPLLPAELISPAVFSMNSANNVILTFSWTGNGKKYDLLMKKPGEDDFHTIASNLNTTLFEMEMTGSIFGTYNWKIRSYDDKGNYVDSAVRNFTFENQE